jgi:GNAT superfamily N-acetyltransferase
MTAISPCAPDQTTPSSADDAERRTASLAIWVRQPWMVRVGRDNVLIRGTSPRDLTAVALMHTRCSAASLLNRYHAGGRAPSPLAIEHILRRTLSFIACTSRGDVIGHAVAWADPSHPAGAAEIGLLVQDDWQRRGIGREMLTHLAGGAFVCGYSQLIAYTATDQPATQRLLTGVGRTFAVRGPSRGVAGHLHTYLTEASTLGLGAVREHLAS